ncbi:hypothetical protein HV319_07100 [Citrobacter freundii]|uniref:SinI family autotransporter-associated protein n=1 Tax=Citrobacter freundii TaxID=546 RepID=UPI0015EAB566|nr:SinI family autotransporter-associated protein [Citrobacter freundii]QLR91287.1 hypothetical protein HV330_07100 [Citrobacter freundii]QLS39072.1 hypothetical protein HV319_07100 [Citrobacter freundii]HEE0039888.1 hypothetical protein [Citrobacter freundii]HEE9922606.1 hypothetical protein [Citrobacter freundii]
MQLVLKRRLTKVALALAVAGYCAVPAVAANGNLKAGQWQSATESTGTIQGTIPWITRAADKTAETDKAHVTVTIDRGSRTVATEGDRQFHAGDKVKVNWAIGDPNVATELLLNDLSTNAGGGSDDDDIPEGPVVDANVHVVIYEAGTTTNLLGTSTKLKTNTTYKVLLWKDKNASRSYDAGEEVTSDYNYRWKFTGNSLQLGTVGGIVNATYNNSDLVIPLTNAEAKAAFDNADGVTLGNDGVQGYGLSIDYQRK